MSLFAWNLLLMTYQAYKAEVDVTKYLIEAENAHGGNEKKLNKLNKRFEKENAKLYEYKLAKQKTEVEIAKTENKIRDIKSNVKNQQKEKTDRRENLSKLTVF